MSLESDNASGLKTEPQIETIPISAPKLTIQVQQSSPKQNVAGFRKLRSPRLNTKLQIKPLQKEFMVGNL